jgi:Domain of unknown function (DUF4335)
MSLPNSVIRRYTPPTCTLEVAAKESPLSRWVGQPVLKHLRFNLSFDDPRVSEDKWVKVQGDRIQLEALYEAVTTYVQTFLNQSPQLLPLAPAIAESSANEVSTGTIDHHRSGDFLNESPLPFNRPDSTPAQLATLRTAPQFVLQPKGLLSHELSLGPLATADTGATIQLSAIQLADLAAALDEYRADVTALPNLDRPSWVKASPIWARVAAVGLIFVGVSASLVRLFEPAPSTQIASPTSSQGASSADQRLAVQPFSSPTPTASPSGLPLLVTPVPPTSNSTTTPASPTSSPAAASSPNQLPTVAVPKKAPTPAEADQPAALKIETPLAQSEGVSVPPLISAVPEAAAPAARTRASTAQSSDANLGELTAAAPAPSVPQESATAFDTAPQVAEVRNYFKTNWKPPEGLAEDLEYSLVVTPNGAVQQIIPLKKVAEEFRDRVNMPAIGAPFLSPTKNNNLRIRLVLSPDGKVQTFSESSSGQ